MSEYLTPVLPETICQQIIAELKTAGVGYGENNELWHVSPEYFVVSSEQLKQMQETTKLFQQYRVAVTGIDTPFYLRGDYIPLVNGKVALAEFNELPVGEAEVATLRQVYKKMVPYPEGASWPFSDAVSDMAELLMKCYPDKKIAIAVPLKRMSYLKDYYLLSAKLKQLGVPLEVYTWTWSPKVFDDIKVLYQVFQMSDLVGWRLGSEIWNKVKSKELEVYPALPLLGSKQIQASIFMDENLADEFLPLKELLPWTWIVKSDQLPIINGQTYSWDAVKSGHFPVSLVAKPTNGREGKNIVFSKWDNLMWRNTIGQALAGYNKGEAWIVQEDFSGQMARYSFPYYDTYKKNMATNDGYSTNLGARLCFTSIGANCHDGSIADIDVSLLKGDIIHTTKFSIHLPVLIGQ